MIHCPQCESACEERLAVCPVCNHRLAAETLGQRIVREFSDFVILFGFGLLTCAVALLWAGSILVLLAAREPITALKSIGVGLLAHWLFPIMRRRLDILSRAENRIADDSPRR